MIDEKALEAACVAIATAAGMERDSVDEVVARAAILAYESAKQKGEAEGLKIGGHVTVGGVEAVVVSADKLRAMVDEDSEFSASMLAVVEFRAMLSAGGEG